jgi:uroporphyrinogen decarboxylase
MFNPMLAQPNPDFSRLVRTLRGAERPPQAPLVELFLDGEILQALHQRFMEKPWVPLSASRAQYVQQGIALYWRLGFDYVPINHWHNFLNQPQLDMVKTQDTAALSRGERGYVMTGHGRVRSWDDFERIPWDRIVPDYSVYELAIPYLPEGMKIVTETTFFQNMVDVLFGYDGLCTLLYDAPDLVEAAFERWGRITLDLFETVMAWDEVGAVFHADDLGFKTNTLVSREVLRHYYYPWMKRFVDVAHRHGKMFWLHCCGNVYANGTIDDLLGELGIDAFHSFQDTILPVSQFVARYRDRVAALGGVDMHLLCTLPEPDLRRYVRTILERGVPSGRYACGSGNSVANYVPLDNYLVLLEEVRRT